MLCSVKPPPLPFLLVSPGLNSHKTHHVVQHKRTLFTKAFTAPGQVKQRPLRIVHTNGASTNIYLGLPGKRNTFKCATDMFSKVPAQFYKEVPTESPWEWLEKHRPQTRKEKEYEAKILADVKGTAARAAELDKQLAEQEASEAQKEEAKKANTRALREKAKKQKEEEKRELKEAAKKFGTKK